MKRIYVALGLLLVIAGICLYSSLVLKNHLESTSTDLDDIMKIAEEDEELAYGRLLIIYNQVRDHDTFYSLFVRRDVYYELLRLFSSVPHDDVAMGAKTIKEQVEILLHSWFTFI